ncbi:HIT domain-containing protein [bacterium]|nr:HIT domain-containing protein [bacterium]
MDNLWAPWRIEYILGDKEGACFLCDAPRANDDPRTLVLIRAQTCFAILNRYPYNPGHLLVAPYKHTGELEDLSQQEAHDLMDLTRCGKQLLARTMNPDGFNIGFNLGRVAGAGVLDHLHLHVVPRWNGDTNYMPVLADTRVVPQALADTWAELRKNL